MASGGEVAALRRAAPATRALVLLPLALGAALCATVARAPAPPPLVVHGAERYGLSAAARAEAFWQIGQWHSVWRARAAAHFPDHPWSAEDDYHWNVRSHVHRVVAPAQGVHPSAIWALYDEAVHARWPVAAPRASNRAPASAAAPLPATVVPLRPRTR